MGKLWKVLRPLAVVAVIAGLGFISLGDSFLPDPWGRYSRQTREQINQKLMGAPPQPKIKKPSEAREKQLEQLR